MKRDKDSNVNDTKGFAKDHNTSQNNSRFTERPSTHEAYSKRKSQKKNHISLKKKSVLIKMTLGGFQNPLIQDINFTPTVKLVKDFQKRMKMTGLGEMQLRNTLTG